jgi:hypothetical protein
MGEDRITSVECRFIFRLNIMYKIWEIMVKVRLSTQAWGRYLGN